jgi:DNA-binding winged helix-turn-helix (wHTH) protein
VTYQFARFVVDGDTRQLWAADREVHVSPKAFALLLVLIEQRARALSKAELQERLWPSTFVGETNLATLVAELRRALDDSPHDAQFVRTVHRYGYRFVASVTEGPAPPAASHRVVRMYVTTGGRQFALGEGEIVIGRGSDAGICIDSGGVSRRHARVLVNGDAAHVEDLGSKNGTFVAGTPITGRRRLVDGDEIRVGPVMLTFRVAPPTQATETLAAEAEP